MTRWSFWIALIIAGVTLPFVIALPETYGPIILKRRAQRLRKETGDPNIFAPVELEKRSVSEVAVTTISRPIRMFCFESIVFCSSIYMAFCYGIFYLFLVCYPLIFQGVYGMSVGVSGLAFIPLGVGALIGCVSVLWWDVYLAKAKALNKPWSAIEEYRRLPIGVAGAPLYPIALFWLGWTSRASVHWIVPMLSGVVFGAGYLFTFMALINYMTDAYRTYAASANAAASCTRSLFGALLPFAGRPMFDALGIDWGLSVLGFISLAFCIIPVAFIKYGDRIRASSKFCQALEKQRLDAAALEEEERRKRAHDGITDGRPDEEKV